MNPPQYPAPSPGGPASALEEDRSRKCRLCIVAGCGRKHSGNGYCDTHWQRNKKHGNPLAHIPVGKPVGVAQNGAQNPNWKGGTTKDGDGRVYVYASEHPNADRRNYVYRHRLVMEAHLGRYLLRSEIVHHKNRDITDDRIENLELMQSLADHARLHAKERRERVKV